MNAVESEFRTLQNSYNSSHLEWEMRLKESVQMFKNFESKQFVEESLLNKQLQDLESQVLQQAKEWNSGSV